MRKVRQTGAVVTTPKSPTQIYFVPNSTLRSRISTAAHDFRSDMVTIPAGTKVYDIYATNKEIRSSVVPSLNTFYANDRRKSAVKIGEMVLTSKFTTSAFGDQGVFFKHQRFEDK